MSLFGKILDKPGRRKEEIIIIGTAKVRPPDPLSTASTSASEMAANEKSFSPAKPTGFAPVSDQDDKVNDKRFQ